MKKNNCYTDIELTWSGYQYHTTAPNDWEIWENKFTGTRLIISYDYNSEKYFVHEVISGVF